MNKILYTVNEATKLLLCNKNQVNSLLNRGEIPYIDELGRRKILHSEIVKYLERTSKIHKKA